MMRMVLPVVGGVGVEGVANQYVACFLWSFVADTEQSGGNHLLTGVNSLPLRQYLVPGVCPLLVPCEIVMCV